VERRPAPQGARQEIRDQAQARALAFLGVELGADDGVAGDDGGDRAAIIDMGEEVGGVGDRIA
jgi:hypothetical protein